MATGEEGDCRVRTGKGGVAMPQIDTVLINVQLPTDSFKELRKYRGGGRPFLFNSRKSPGLSFIKTRCRPTVSGFR